MAITYADRVWFGTPTVGTSTTIAVGSATSGGYQTPAGASVTSGAIVCYAIQDSSNFEIQLYQTYTSGSPATITRGTPSSSSNGGSQISLSGEATAFLILPAEQIATQRLPTVVLTANGTLGVIPAAPAALSMLTLQETAGTAVVVNLGVSSGGTQIASSVTVGASAVVSVPSSSMLAASFASASTVYVSSSSWGGASLDVTGWFLL